MRLRLGLLQVWVDFIAGVVISWAGGTGVPSDAGSGVLETVGERKLKNYLPGNLAWNVRCF